MADKKIFEKRSASFTVLISLVGIGITVFSACFYVATRNNLHKARCRDVCSSIEVTKILFDQEYDSKMTSLKTFSYDVQKVASDGTIGNTLFETKKAFDIKDANFYFVDNAGNYYLDTGDTGKIEDSVYEKYYKKMSSNSGSYVGKFSDDPALDYDTFYFVNKLTDPLELKVATSDIDKVTIPYVGIYEEDSVLFNKIYSYTDIKTDFSILDKTGAFIYTRNTIKNFSIGESAFKLFDDTKIRYGDKSNDLLRDIKAGNTVAFEYLIDKEQYVSGFSSIKNTNWIITSMIASKDCPIDSNVFSVDSIVFLGIIVLLLIFALGSIIFFIVSSKDTNKILLKEQEVNAALSSASKSKSDFLARMSHDIRTPINAIVGFTQIALKEGEIDEKTRENLNKIDSSSKHLLSIINDVLDITKIESGSLEIKHEVFDFDILINQIIDIANGIKKDKNIEFVVEKHNIRKTHYLGDALKIKQVLMNLITNAIKFTNDGGKVVFGIRDTYFDGNSSTLKFTVSDTGCGMSHEFLEHIWEEFSQENVDQVRTTYSGTGLGLPIAKKLVDAMKGYITVESYKDEGTTFTFIITLETATTGNLEDVDVSENQTDDLNGIKVLMVEDNELNIELAKDLLEMEGAIVSVAKNGQEGVDMFSTSPTRHFDVILMDIMMPIMNGIDATKAIRALPRADSIEIPIIAMTANAFADDVKKTQEAGMDDHLSKPIDIRTVVKTINKYIKR